MSSEPKLHDLANYMAQTLRLPASYLDPKYGMSAFGLLRHAGILPVGKRGRGNFGGARAEPEHAAALLLAILGSAHPAQAVESVQRLGSLHYAGEAVAIAITGANIWIPATSASEPMTFADWLSFELIARAAGNSERGAVLKIANVTGESPRAFVEYLDFAHGVGTKSLFLPEGVEPPAAYDIWSPVEDCRSISGVAFDLIVNWLKNPRPVSVQPFASMESQQ